MKTNTEIDPWTCRYCGFRVWGPPLRNRVCSKLECRDEWVHSEEYRMLLAAERCAEQMAKNLRLMRAETRICGSCNGEIFDSGNGHGTNCLTAEAGEYIQRQEAIYGH